MCRISPSRFQLPLRVQRGSTCWLESHRRVPHSGEERAYFDACRTPECSPGARRTAAYRLMKHCRNATASPARRGTGMLAPARIRNGDAGVPHARSVRHETRQNRVAFRIRLSAARAIPLKRPPDRRSSKPLAVTSSSPLPPGTCPLFNILCRAPNNLSRCHF